MWKEKKKLILIKEMEMSFANVVNLHFAVHKFLFKSDVKLKNSQAKGDVIKNGKSFPFSTLYYDYHLLNS